MLPGVRISINTSGIGSVPQVNDGVAGLLLSSADVAGLPIGEPKQIFSLQQAEAFGITEANDVANGMNAWKQIKQFYEQAGEGTELWIMLYPNILTMSEVLDPANIDYAVKLLNAAQGKIRLLGIDKVPARGSTVAQIEGLDSDVWGALEMGELLAQWAESRIMPVRILISGRAWTGVSADLADLKQKSSRHCAVILASTGAGEVNGAVGLTLGRLVSLPVQRNLGRVKDGPVLETEAYLTDGKSVEDHILEIEAIHDKGYIVWRKFVGKSGYYFNDDHTAIADTDDFSSLARGRVMDKALILTYQTYIEEVNDEVPINQDGTLPASYVKALQAKIENVINQTMTAKGEISGVKAYIDASQNVQQTGELKINISILPVGYAKYINVELGFTNVLNS